MWQRPIIINPFLIYLLILPYLFQVFKTHAHFHMQSAKVKKENNIAWRKYTVWRHHHLLGPHSLFLKRLYVRMRLFPSSALCCFTVDCLMKVFSGFLCEGLASHFSVTVQRMCFYAHPGVSYLSASLRTESSRSQHKVKKQKKQNTTLKLHGAPLNCSKWTCGGKNSIRLCWLLSGPVKS